jgi:transcriptional regulator with XRE-family HTH domain
MSKKRWTARQKKLQELLRQIRVDKGMTQAQVAEYLGVPQSYVSKYESGERRLDILEVQDICSVYGVTLDKFARKLGE